MINAAGSVDIEVILKKILEHLTGEAMSYSPLIVS
jgi:hypothetical protein